MGFTAPSVQADPTGGAEQIKPKERRRIAVLNFDFASVSETGFLLGMYGGNGASVGVSNLITNELAKRDSYILIERSRIDAVLAEQNLGESGRIEPTTAAEIGRILGVDAVLIGSVTKFNVEDQTRGVSLGSVFGFGGSQKKQTATVQIASRLVSTGTGEILAVAEGTGQAQQKDEGGQFLGIGTTASSNSRDRVLSDAAEMAVTEVVNQLDALAPKVAALPPVLPAVDVMIADITGSQVVLNKGGKDGFRPGMTLSVERVVKTVKDPATGKVLRTLTQPIGRIQLTDVDATSSLGKILNGTGFKVGDRAKAIN